MNLLICIISPPHQNNSKDKKRIQRSCKSHENPNFKRSKFIIQLITTVFYIFYEFCDICSYQDPENPIKIIKDSKEEPLGDNIFCMTLIYWLSQVYVERPKFNVQVGSTTQYFSPNVKMVITFDRK